MSGSSQSYDPLIHPHTVSQCDHVFLKDPWDPVPQFRNHPSGLQSSDAFQQGTAQQLEWLNQLGLFSLTYTYSTVSDFKATTPKSWNQTKLNVFHWHFGQRALLGDSSWTLHRANSGTGCTKTWPRSEASPYINPDGIRFPRHLPDPGSLHTKLRSGHCRSCACFHQNIPLRADKTREKQTKQNRLNLQ